MENRALTKTEQSALQVSYEVNGTQVALDPDFVKRYLVRGRADSVTDQELLMFMNTCKQQRLNPLAQGEVYLIKYDSGSPAQTVVGKYAYMKRAYNNPSYLGKEDGVVVLRGNDVVAKKGCCVYDNEKLIGGWCRVFYERSGRQFESYREVSLKEYSTGKSNWASKPATMINKVAVAQCLREAFPAEYEGLYSEEEMPAAEAKSAPAGVPLCNEDGEVLASTGDRPVTHDERKELFTRANEVYGPQKAAAVVKEILSGYGLNNTQEMTKAQYDLVFARIESDAEPAESEPDGEDEASWQ